MEFHTTNNNGGGGTLSSDKAITSSALYYRQQPADQRNSKDHRSDVPIGTNLTALVATFTTTGTGV